MRTLTPDPGKGSRRSETEVAAEAAAAPDEIVSKAGSAKRCGRTRVEPDGGRRC